MSAPDVAEEWVANMIGGRMIIDLDDVEQSRSMFQGLFENLKPMLPAPTPAVKAEDVNIPAGQQARIYVPSNASTLLPIGLYVHSGGWYTGSIEAEDFVCRRIAEQSQMILISPEYRLAPEHPYLAGLEDCYHAYKYLHDNASQYGGDPLRKYIMGGSAGGNLATCVSLKYATDPQLKPTRSVIACFLSCDSSAMPAGYKDKFAKFDYSKTPMINDNAVRLAREWYNCPNPSDPLYSPLLHPDLKHLSRLHLIAPTADPTYPETWAFH